MHSAVLLWQGMYREGRGSRQPNYTRDSRGDDASTVIVFNFFLSLTLNTMHQPDPLEVNPESKPVASDTVSLKPDVQNEIKSSTGGRNIRIYVPPYLNHTLMSQSLLTYNLQIEGRGAPVPVSSAASLFSTVRVHDGSAAHLIEETLNYGCFVKQLFDATNSETMSSQRAFFEGSQPNESISDNLYFGNPATWYGGSGVTVPNESKTVQIAQPLHTHFLSSPDFLPVGVMQGLRLELITDNYLRSLRYTTGSLGVDSDYALPTNLNIPLTPTDLPEIAGPPAYAAVPQLTVVVGHGGTQYAPGEYVRVTSSSISGAVGVIKVVTITGGSATGPIGTAELFSTGTEAPDESNTTSFVPNDELTLAASAAGGTVAKLKVPHNVNPMGAGRKSNAKVEFLMPICGPTDITYAATNANQGPEGTFGTNTVLDPLRKVDPYVASYKKPFPTDISPFEVGDRLYMSKVDKSGEVELGLVTGLSILNNRYAIKFSPNVALSTDDGAQNNPLLTTPFSHTVVSGHAERAGIRIYIKNADRVNGWSNFAHLGANFAVARTAAAQKVGYTISDMQYQVKRVFLDEKRVAAELAAANGERGVQVDVPTLYSGLVNVTRLTGPSSQLISVPNITKATSVLSVPLAQSKQYDLRFDAYQGINDDSEEYQYQIGDHVEPQRPVDMTPYAGNNPLWSVQHLMEYIKAYESAGYFPTNITHIGNNLVFGRAFAKKGMFFNLMEAGDLSLKIRYGPSSAQDKLFVHYISHIRSILINRNGMQIFN